MSAGNFVACFAYRFQYCDNGFGQFATQIASLLRHQTTWRLNNMKRRQVLKYASGLATLCVLEPVIADPFIEFTPEIYSQALDSGEPFMLGFLSDW